MYRKVFEQLKAHLNKKEYTIITGARQTGKSTLLRQLESCKSKETPCIFFNLENKSILSDLNENPLNLLKYLPNVKDKKVALIDEIQYLKDPSNFLKLLYDDHADEIKIVATGSSAFYLDSRFKDSLAGRKRIFKLLTCSFDEYLELSGKNDLQEELKRIINEKDAKSTQIDYLKNEWENYMLYGGYPAVITEPDIKEKVARLKEIRDSFVKRDIMESGVADESAFYNLFRTIAGQSGNLVNVNELSNTLRIKNETVNRYLEIMQKCFHIALIKPFFRNLRKELVKMPKAYMLDTGLRNCLLNNFQFLSSRLDKGELWENMYFRILAGQYDWDTIHYWRTTTGNEIDFILPYIATPQAIEVKYDRIGIKEEKYNKFIEAYPDIQLSFAWMVPFGEDFFRRVMIN